MSASKLKKFASFRYKRDLKSDSIQTENLQDGRGKSTESRNKRYSFPPRSEDDTKKPSQSDVKLKLERKQQMEALVRTWVSNERANMDKRQSVSMGDMENIDVAKQKKSGHKNVTSLTPFGSDSILTKQPQHDDDLRFNLVIEELQHKFAARKWERSGTPFHISRKTQVTSPFSNSEVQVRRTSSSLIRHDLNRSKTCFLYPSRQTTIEDASRLTVIKEGPIDRVKTMLPGKKLPKHWKSRYACLTDRGLFFAEDSHVLLAMKSGNEPGNPTEKVDLQGAKISQTCEHTTKKNVIMLIARDGQLTLVQNDNQDKADGWLDAITGVIQRLNSNLVLPLTRSASLKALFENTIHESQVDIKKSTLKKFFKRRPTKEALENKGIYKDEPVFGNSLQRLCTNTGNFTPSIVKRCIDVLELPKHISSVGLYRTSGNLSQIQRLRLQVDQNNIDEIENLEDSDVLAGALKLFFRELKEPLIPHECYLKLQEIMKLASEEERVARVRSCIHTLSKPHLYTLKALCRHLAAVCKHEQENQMNAGNMAIVWGPSLTWHMNETSQDRILNCTSVNRVVEFLIRAESRIF